MLLLLALLLCIVSLSWYVFSLLVVLAKPSVLVEKDICVCPCGDVQSSGVLLEQGV